MALPELSAALALLSRCVLNFPVGAITLDDLKQLPEQVKDVKYDLKAQKAHYLLLSAKHNIDKLPEKTEAVVETIDDLLKVVSDQQISNMAIDMCLSSYTIIQLLLRNVATLELQKRTHALLGKFFLLVDMLPRIDSMLNDALKEEREMKIECDTALSNYQTFLKVQKKRRAEEQEAINPEISQVKKQLDSKLMRINLMKVLILNMVGAAKDKISKHKQCELVQKHRDTISSETIIEMSYAAESHDNL